MVTVVTALVTAAAAAAVALVKAVTAAAAVMATAAVAAVVAAEVQICVTVVAGLFSAPVRKSGRGKVCLPLKVTGAGWEGRGTRERERERERDALCVSWPDPYAYCAAYAANIVSTCNWPGYLSSWHIRG